MIDTLDPHKCTGCFACVQKCPKHCIAIIKDHEGFLAPKINAEGQDVYNAGYAKRLVRN